MSNLMTALDHAPFLAAVLANPAEDAALDALSRALRAWAWSVEPKKRRLS